MFEKPLFLYQSAVCFFQYYYYIIVISLFLCHHCHITHVKEQIFVVSFLNSSSFFLFAFVFCLCYCYLACRARASAPTGPRWQFSHVSSEQYGRPIAVCYRTGGAAQVMYDN